MSQREEKGRKTDTPGDLPPSLPPSPTKLACRVAKIDSQPQFCVASSDTVKPERHDVKRTKLHRRHGVTQDRQILLWGAWTAGGSYRRSLRKLQRSGREDALQAHYIITTHIKVLLRGMGDEECSTFPKKNNERRGKKEYLEREGGGGELNRPSPSQREKKKLSRKRKHTRTKIFGSATRVQGRREVESTLGPIAELPLSSLENGSTAMQLVSSFYPISISVFASSLSHFLILSYCFGHMGCTGFVLFLSSFSFSLFISRLMLSLSVVSSRLVDLGANPLGSGLDIFLTLSPWMVGRTGLWSMARRDAETRGQRLPSSTRVGEACHGTSPYPLAQVFSHTPSPCTPDQHNP